MAKFSTSRIDALIRVNKKRKIKRIDDFDIACFVGVAIGILIILFMLFLF